MVLFFDNMDEENIDSLFFPVAETTVDHDCTSGEH